MLLDADVARTHEIAFGLECMWWGAVSDAHHETTSQGETTSHGERFRCPTCGGACATMGSEQAYLQTALRFELLGFARHLELVRWVKGQCFRTRGEAWSAFASRGVALV